MTGDVAEAREAKSAEKSGSGRARFRGGSYGLDQDRSSRDGNALRDGDSVYVTQARYYFVYGEVKKPGRYVLTKDTTVLKAITTAGGLTEIAAVKRAKIVRERAGVRVKLKAKLSDWVSPEDIIMVPQSFF